MHPNLVRQHSLGERHIFVLDDLFTAQAVGSMNEFLGRLPYRLNDIDSDHTAYSRHWKAELPVAMAFGAPIFRQVAELVPTLFAENLNLWRIHSNLHLYGDMQFPHVDCRDGVTGLYYANSRWDENWLGETVFYNDARDPVYAVAPRPGRVVLFHGGIIHRAGVPSRECFEPRISVALKFQPASPVNTQV